MIPSLAPAAFVRPSMRHVDEIMPEPPRSFSAFRIGGLGGLCGFDSHAHLASMVGLFEKGFFHVDT